MTLILVKPLNGVRKMTLLSKLRTRVASWLLGRDVATLQHPTTSPLTLTHEQWALLSGLLSFLSNTGPSSTPSMDIIQDCDRKVAELEVKIAEANLRTAEVQLLEQQQKMLPHRHYTPAMSHDGVQWVAVAKFANGDTLVGRGNCPEAALMDYSNQWLGIKGE